jgi:predicted nucleic acid-binding protein
MISVDTSVIVRYLVGTPVAQAKRAAALMDGESVVGISLVALVETAHVLRTQYGVERGDVLEVLFELLTRENVELLGLPKNEALAAFVRARPLAGSPIPDALMAATATWARALPVYTFDRDFARHGAAVETP